MIFDSEIEIGKKKLGVNIQLLLPLKLVQLTMDWNLLNN